MNFLIKIFNLLTKKEKFDTSLIFLTIIICAFLETLSVGLVLPVISIILNESILDKFSFLEPYFLFINDYEKSTLVLFTLLLIIIVYLIKGLLLIFHQWQLETHFNKIHVRLNNDLLKKYIGQPFLFHINNNSATIMRNLDAAAGIPHSLIKFLNLIIDTVIIIFLTTFLCFYNLKGTLIIFSLILLVSIIHYTIFKKKIKNLSFDNLKHTRLYNKTLLETLGYIKFIKLYKIENFFLSKFNFHLFNKVKIAKIVKVISSSPRSVLELFAVISMSIIVIVMINLGNTNFEIITSLALFGLAGFKILPSANKILVNLSAIKFSFAAIDLVYNDFKIKNFTSSPSKNNELKDFIFEKKISFKDVFFKYPENQNDILSNITLSVNKGDCIGIIGKSGSGKTTLMNLLTGLIEPSKGEIMIDGHSLKSKLDCWQSKIGYVPQSIYLSDESIKKNIALGYDEKKISDEKIIDLLKQTQLDEFVKKLPSGIDTIIGEKGQKLSGGQAQRIGLARAFFRDPEIIILDEATSSLDNETQNLFIKNLKELNTKKTIFIVSHRREALKYCNKIYEVKDSNLVETKN